MSWSKFEIVTGPSTPESVLDEYVASNTKFSASVCAVKLVVPSSIFEPEDKSGPAEDTDPAKILMLIDFLLTQIILLVNF